PVATGAVEVGLGAKYRGVAFQRFAAATLRVDTVLGEFYWRALDRGSAECLGLHPLPRGALRVAPPRAGARRLRPPPPRPPRWGGAGVGVAQARPCPAPVGAAPIRPSPAGVGKVTGLAVVALFAMGIAKCASAPDAVKMQQHFTIPMMSTTPRPAVDPTLGTE